LDDHGVSEEKYAMARGLADANGESKYTEDIFSQTSLSDAEKAYIALAKYDKGISGDVMTDKIRSGYRFALTDDLRKEYLDYYDQVFAAELQDLWRDSDYINGTAAERAEMFDDLKSEVANDVKEHLSDVWRDRGVKSEKKNS